MDYKNRYDSLCLGVEILQEHKEKLEKENILLRERLEACQSALDINKQIMRDALTAQNLMKEEYGREIAELMEKVKRLENGNHD